MGHYQVPRTDLGVGDPVLGLIIDHAGRAVDHDREVGVHDVDDPQDEPEQGCAVRGHCASSGGLGLAEEDLREVRLGSRATTTPRRPWEGPAPNNGATSTIDQSKKGTTFMTKNQVLPLVATLLVA